MRARVLLAALAIAAVAAGIEFKIVRDELTLQRGQIVEEWSRVEMAIHRRADAIPPMLETLNQGEYDPQFFETARKNLASARGAGEKIRANRELTLAVARLLQACETHPRLRDSDGFRRIREELATHDDEIANARFQYNNALEHYNARMQRFPVNVVASLAGFVRDDAYFGTGPDAAPVPKAPK